MSQNNGNQSFLTFLLNDGKTWSLRIMTDPEGPKTYGSHGSGSTTLGRVDTQHWVGWIHNIG
jgi:hypothetical protein